MKLISKYINKIKSHLSIKVVLKAFEWCLTDRQYLKFVYRIKMGKPLHLNPPITFNEKLQWLKLYNRRNEYTAMVDKVEAKKVAASRIGEEYIIPTLGIWDSVDDIDFDALPDKFVLKTTHGGGGNAIVLCRDKSLLNRSAVKNVLHRSLRKGDSYRWLKEWPYKNVRRRIIAEEMLEDEANEQIVDYKFYCFHGKHDGISAIAIGGAYSVDKDYRLENGWGWWADEQPSDETKARVEKALADRDNKIDVVLSHTTPLKYEPREMFLSCIDQSKVDKSTEEWLDKIEERVDYKKWFCGHYHTNKSIDKLRIMFEDILVFSL